MLDKLSQIKFKGKQFLETFKIIVISIQYKFYV